MSFSLEEFQKAKEEVLTQLSETYSLLQFREDRIKQVQIRKIRQELENEDFVISVVGEFGNGKSAFINAMLGKNILPSLPRTSTSILNSISYSEKPEILVHFLGGKKPSEKVSEKAFRKIIAPRELLEGETDERIKQQYIKEIEYQSSIEFAEIKYPMRLCKDGVRIIDTPGTNDLDPNREKLTNSIIPRSDAAILLLKAVPLLSESEQSFIKDRLLKSDINKLFIVINFKDLLETKEDEQKILKRAYDVLSPMIEHPKVFLLTAKQALHARRIENGEIFKGDDEVLPNEETGFLEFEQELSDFLQYERGQIKIEKPINGTVKLIEEVIHKDLKREMFSLKNDMEMNRDKVESFESKLEYVRQLSKESLKKIDIEFQTKRNNLTKWYQDELRVLANSALSVIDGNLHLSTDELNRKIEATIAPFERNLHIKKKNAIQVLVKNAIESASKQINEEWEQIEIDLDSLFTDDEIDGLPSLHIAMDSESKQDIFATIYEELEGAWETSQGFLGKAGVVTGFVITTAVNVVTSMLRGIWNFFTGGSVEKSREEKIRKQIHNQFEQTRRTRMKQIKQEWDSIQHSVKQNYQTIIDEKVQQTRYQIQRLQWTAVLEKAEAEHRIKEIEDQVKKLEEIKLNFKKIKHSLQIKEVVGV